jgi:large subunit ribosomal protein L11
MIIKLIIEAGDMKPNAAISQKLGPMGINIGKVIAEVNKATLSFKGIKVPVELDVNAKSKEFKVHVSSPPTAELLKKEIGVETASGQAKKTKVGNISIEQIIKIALVKSPSMTAGSLKSAVRSVIGSCVSLGILVENKEAKEAEIEVLQGKYDKEISQEISEASHEKKAGIDKFFSSIKSKQEAEAKKAEELKAAEEAAKAAAPVVAAAPAAATPGKAATAAPAAAAKTAAKPAAKSPAKK